MNRCSFREWIRDIALASVASGRTVSIGAEDGCGVHDDPPPSCAWKHCQEKYVWTPFSLQLHHTTVGCGATGTLIVHTPTAIVCVGRSVTTWGPLSQDMGVTSARILKRPL